MGEPLSAALERFNRKERNLLVRAILGHEEKPLQLTCSFRRRVAGALDDDFAGIPADAWWATDYHISWLAGALAILENDELAVYRGMGRQSLPPWDNPTILKSQLVEGNQEDVDLVIATGSELIMIEAKAFGHYDKVQLESKLQRLELLHSSYNRDMLRPAQNPIRFRFLLISPDKPPEFGIDWPCWTLKKDKTVPWIHLDVGERLTVERCNDRHHRSAEGEHWHIIRVRQQAATPFLHLVPCSRNDSRVPAA